MQRFDGNYGIAFVCGATGAFFLGVVPLVMWLSHGQWGKFTWTEGAAAIFGILMMTAAGILLFYCATVASCAVVLDDAGITQRKLNGNTRITWADLDRADEYCITTIKGQSGFARRCVLYGKNGQKICIWWPMVRDCARLMGMLEPHLVPLRERAIVELAKRGGVFRPQRVNGLGCLTFVAPLFLVGGLAGMELAAKGPAEKGRAPYYFSLIAIAASPFIATLGVELISRTLTVSDHGVTLQSLFLNRYVSFAGIHSIDVKMVAAEEPIQERAKIGGTYGQCITVDSAMPSYRAIVSLARKHAKTKSAVPLIDEI